MGCYCFGLITLNMSEVLAPKEKVLEDKRLLGLPSRWPWCSEMIWAPGELPEVGRQELKDQNPQVRMTSRVLWNLHGPTQSPSVGFVSTDSVFSFHGQIPWAESLCTKFSLGFLAPRKNDSKGCPCTLPPHDFDNLINKPQGNGKILPIFFLENSVCGGCWRPFSFPWKSLLVTWLWGPSGCSELLRQKNNNQKPQTSGSSALSLPDRFSSLHFSIKNSCDPQAVASDGRSKVEQ